MQLSFETYGREIGKWRSVFVRSRGRSKVALEGLSALRESDAAIAIAVLLGRDDPAFERLTVQLLSQLDSVESTQILANYSVTSDDATTRRLASEALANRRHEDFVPVLLNFTAAEIQEMSMSMFWFVTPEEYHSAPYVSKWDWGVLKKIPLELRTNELVRKTMHGNQVLRQQELRVPTQADVRLSSSDRLAQDALKHHTMNAVRDVDARTVAVNRRVHAVLAQVTDKSPSDDPESWWEWWNHHIDAAPTMDSMFVRDLGTVVEKYRVSGLLNHCFEEETHVLTDLGPEFIMNVKPGDLVLSKDVETGELAFKPVLAITMREVSPMIGLGVGKRGLSCTGGHNFWQSGHGWVKARDLVKGSLIHTSSGNIPIERTAIADPQKAINLLVADTHTFFVGEEGLLVQDAKQPGPTNMVVPGLPRSACGACSGTPKAKVDAPPEPEIQVTLPKI